jgi:glycolate oxidase subunit GlcD
VRELSRLLGPGAVLDGDAPAARPYLHDATESRAIEGRAGAVALPETADEVAAVLAWCYDHDVPVIPRGGGTGYAGGAVPLDGGVVVTLERLRGPIEVEAGQWRARVPAGAVTADVRRRARESGLFLPPDPGSAESCLIAGNVATNAGGPHSFKYGVTGAWVTGLQVAMAPGELVELGGRTRKDVAGYDLRSLIVGSEGTLGIVTGAWLRLIPAPAMALPVLAHHPDAGSGCAAVAAVLAAGLQPATLEFLDEPAAAAAGVDPPAFLVLAEADGAHEAEVVALRDELAEVLGAGARRLETPSERRQVSELWRWREGVSLAVAARRGGKLSEDICVPVDRLGEALAGAREIAARHGLESCAWGHAGDGNLHATFMIDRDDPSEVDRAGAAAQELFALALRLEGSVSGEHGIGAVKRAGLAAQLDGPARALHERVKLALDPKGLLNPGKKVPVAPP